MNKTSEYTLKNMYYDLHVQILQKDMAPCKEMIPTDCVDWRLDVFDMYSNNQVEWVMKFDYRLYIDYWLYD